MKRITIFLVAVNVLLAIHANYLLYAEVSTKTQKEVFFNKKKFSCTKIETYNEENGRLKIRWRCKGIRNGTKDIVYNSDKYSCVEKKIVENNNIGYDQDNQIIWECIKTKEIQEGVFVDTDKYNFSDEIINKEGHRILEKQRIVTPLGDSLHFDNDVLFHFAKGSAPDGRYTNGIFYEAFYNNYWFASAVKDSWLERVMGLKWLFGFGDFVHTTYGSIHFKNLMFTPDEDELKNNCPECIKDNPIKIEDLDKGYYNHYSNQRPFFGYVGIGFSAYAENRKLDRFNKFTIEIGLRANHFSGSVQTAFHAFNGCFKGNKDACNFESGGGDTIGAWQTLSDPSKTGVSFLEELQLQMYYQLERIYRIDKFFGFSVIPNIDLGTLYVRGGSDFVFSLSSSPNSSFQNKYVKERFRNKCNFGFGAFIFAGGKAVAWNEAIQGPLSYYPSQYGQDIREFIWHWGCGMTLRVNFSTVSFALLGTWQQYSSQYRIKNCGQKPYCSVLPESERPDNQKSSYGSVELSMLYKI